MDKKTFPQVIKMAGIIFVAVIAVLLACMRNMHVPDKWGMIDTLSGSITGIEYCRQGHLNSDYIEITLMPRGIEKLIYTYKHIPAGKDNEEIIKFETNEYRLDPFREICNTTECLIYNTPVEPVAEADRNIKETVIFHLGEEKIFFETSNIYPANCNEIYKYVYNAFINIKEQYT